MKSLAYSLPISSSPLIRFRAPILVGALVAMLQMAYGQDAPAPSQLPTDYPPEAQVITAQALKDRLANHVFKARLFDRSGWRLQFKGDYIYLNLSSGASDSGRWRTEDSRLCVDYQRFPSGCSDIRATDSAIFLKRGSTGEVVALVIEP